MVEFIKDRRRHQRINQNVPIKIFQENGDIVTETSNVSEAGIYCKINKPLKPMTKLKVRLLLPVRKSNKVVTKQLSCQGIIVRSEPAAKGQYYIAVFFNELTAKEADVICDYVNCCLEQQSVNLS